MIKNNQTAVSFELANDWLAEQTLARVRDKSYFFTLFRSRFRYLKSSAFSISYFDVYRDLEIGFFGGRTRTLAGEWFSVPLSRFNPAARAQPMSYLWYLGNYEGRSLKPPN